MPVTESVTDHINGIVQRETIAEANMPYIEGDTIVNATRGKSAELTCIIHNVKNYKVWLLFKIFV